MRQLRGSQSLAVVGAAALLGACSLDLPEYAGGGSGGASSSGSSSSTSTSSSGTSSSSSSGGGSGPQAPIRLGEGIGEGTSAEPGKFRALAAYGGAAYVSIDEADGSSAQIWRVPLDGSLPTQLDIVPAGTTDVHTIHADAHGIVWGGGNNIAVVGGSDHDGLGSWAITDVYQGQTYNNGQSPVNDSEVYNVVSQLDPAGALWASSINSYVVRLPRGCTGTPSNCQSFALTDYAGSSLRTCMVHANELGYVFVGMYSGSAIVRLAANLAAQAPATIFAQLQGANQGRVYCALVGTTLVWTTRSGAPQRCLAQADPLPCSPQPWGGLPAGDYGPLAYDGAAVLGARAEASGGFDIVSWEPEGAGAEVLATVSSGQAVRLAVDAAGIYWLAGNVQLQLNELYAVPR